MRREHLTRLFMLVLTTMLLLSLVGGQGVAMTVFTAVSAGPVATPQLKIARAAAASVPIGLNPLMLCAVYNLPCHGGSGNTVAVVDAYADPTIVTDLARFKAAYGVTGCNLTVVNQLGHRHLPKITDSAWALETSLDVEWVCAMAPQVNILLVEANTSGLSDLLVAEDFAVAHAQYVSISWGTAEFAGEVGNDAHFNHTGVSIFAAAGDSGLGAQFPSVSPYVLSVGGTTLSFIGGAFQSETGWRYSGGGCSVYEPASAAQTGNTGNANCSGKRATPDVSFDADPASGVAVYDSTPYNGQAGWFQVGGTSLGAPVWAAIAADAGGVMNARAVYAFSATHFRDIVTGNNGAPCQPGYDLVTGRGSPLAVP